MGCRVVRLTGPDRARKVRLRSQRRCPGSYATRTTDRNCPDINVACAPALLVVMSGCCFLEGKVSRDPQAVLRRLFRKRISGMWLADADRLTAPKFNLSEDDHCHFTYLQIPNLI